MVEEAGSGSVWIGRLTLLFLGRLDRTRRFLAVYGAFWDESGVNREDPWLTVAGFLSTADRWVEFTADWQEQLQRFEIPMFHASRFNASRASEYRGWTRKRRVDCSTALVDVILRYAVGSVGISVPGQAIRKAILPAYKGKAGHPYAVAGRLCMVEAAGLLRGTLKIEGDLTLNHMFASGADGYGELMMVHDHESVRPTRVDHLVLGSVTFAAQAPNPPLQAADFLAWELNRFMRVQRPIRTSLRRLREELPHRWFRLDEDDVGAQMLMAIFVKLNRSETIRSARQSRRMSRHDH